MSSVPEFTRLSSLKLHGIVTNVTDWVGHFGLQAQMTLWIVRFAQENRQPVMGTAEGCVKELHSLARRQRRVRSLSNSLGGFTK
jgi:hypothetical protein